MTSVDRLRWIEERVRFLEELLATDVSDQQRAAFESEIQALRKEGGSSRRWLRRLFGLPGNRVR